MFLRPTQLVVADGSFALKSLRPLQVDADLRFYNVFAPNTVGCRRHPLLDESSSRSSTSRATSKTSHYRIREQNALCARAVSARRNCVSLFYDLYFYVPLRKFNLWDTLLFAGSVLCDFLCQKDPSLFSATRANQTLTRKVKYRLSHIR